MKADGIRLLGWGIPILCMLIAGFTLYSERQQFEAASIAHNQAQRDVERAQQDFNASQGRPAGLRYATKDDLPEEEIEFLNYLRTRIAANGATLKSWFSQSVEYGKDKQAASKDDQTAALLKGIRKVSASLTLTGSYQNIRKFLGEIQGSNRLYTITGVQWSTTNYGTQMTAMVSRYVAPPKPGLKKPEDPKKAAPVAPVAPGNVPGQNSLVVVPAKPDPTKPTTTPIKPETKPAVTQPIKPGAVRGITIKP